MSLLSSSLTGITVQESDVYVGGYVLAFSDAPISRITRYPSRVVVSFAGEFSTLSLTKGN